MADPVRLDDRRYTYRDYAEWPEDERWELIDGVAYSMSPAPGTTHQAVIGKLFTDLYVWIEKHGGPCRVFVSAWDVHLPATPDQDDQDIDTIVQPDITVVCDPAKILERGCRGAPDIAVEVLSPWSTHHDQVRKLELYARHRVREYWVVDPGNRCVRVYTLRPTGGFDEPLILPQDRVVVSRVLEGYRVPVASLFGAQSSS